MYFGFGIATLNEIPDGDTFLRCEARADMRLQVYKSQHHDRIYRHLRAYIEEITGQKVDFNDNRTLDYIERQAHNDAEPEKADKGNKLSSNASNKAAGLSLLPRQLRPLLQPRVIARPRSRARSKMRSRRPCMQSI